MQEALGRGGVPSATIWVVRPQSMSSFDSDTKLIADEDQIVVMAPFGLRDLFDLLVRPNLVTPDAAAVYRERMITKRWIERWPKLART